MQHVIQQPNEASATLLALAVALLLTLPSCMPQSPPKAPETMTVSYTLPAITPVEAGTETQERGGLVLQMAPEPFTAEKAVAMTCRELPSMLITNNQYPYEVREIPSYTVPKTDLVFPVKLTNRTSQVLRLDSAVFKLTVNDQEVAIPREAYAEFSSTVMTPGQQKEYAITGPEWSSLPAQATVHFAIFGLPTETDEAGNVTKRENFQWTFSFKAETKAEQAQVAVNTAYMTKQEAASRCTNLGAR